jgi:hypothetical protein
VVFLTAVAFAPRLHAAPQVVDIPGGQIDVAFDGDPWDSVRQARLLQWVETSARGVARYFGRYPVPRSRIVIRAGRGRPVGPGTTFGGAVPRTRIAVNPDATDLDLQDDWVLTHEMTHLAFPDLTTDDAWAEEGLATYVEPLARMRAGTESEAAMWKELMQGLPKGQPRQGDPGLHGTQAWGRTYWGGAQFWLLADVELRQKTIDRRGLDDALRAVLDAGGDIRAKWTLSRTLAVADRALGVTVLADLYRRLGSKAETVDLQELWRTLGVRRGGPRGYDDAAPLAWVRRAIGSNGKESS